MKKKHESPNCAQGAKVLTGGKAHALGGTWWEPTVLSKVRTDMVIHREEVFGPVAPLFRFKTEEEAIQMANETEFGEDLYLMDSSTKRQKK